MCAFAEYSGTENRSKDSDRCHRTINWDTSCEVEKFGATTLVASSEIRLANQVPPDFHLVGCTWWVEFALLKVVVLIELIYSSFQLSVISTYCNREV